MKCNILIKNQHFTPNLPFTIIILERLWTNALQNSLLFIKYAYGSSQIADQYCDKTTVFLRI